MYPFPSTSITNMPVLLSVLTDPVPVGKYRVSEAARAIARPLRQWLKPGPSWMRLPYRGHFAVTRSLVEGLAATGIRYNYNPTSVQHLGDVAVVLSGTRTLAQAIELKRRGRISKLLAGPNIVEFPSDARALLCATEVDLCITPGLLTSNLYVEDCPELAGRCAAWPAGVDVRYWAPDASGSPRDKIIVYDKQVQGPTAPREPFIQFVKSKGYDVTVLTYGCYSSDEYRKLLQEAQLMIGFTAAESQGIAWTEAWATDVPTLLWYKGAHSFNHPRSQGRTFETSPAPYLTAQTGGMFKSMDEFEWSFMQWEQNKARFQPREWVLNNMSDEVCARLLCGLAGLAVVPGG
jgi:hypothetical protein